MRVSVENKRVKSFFLNHTHVPGICSKKSKLRLSGTLDLTAFLLILMFNSLYSKKADYVSYFQNAILYLQTIDSLTRLSLMISSLRQLPVVFMRIIISGL